MPDFHPIDLSDLLKPYTGKWVALNSEETEVIGSGLTLDDALEQAHQRGEERPLVMRVPDQFTPFFL